MTNSLYKDTQQSRRYAVSLSFAAATLTGLQASHHATCAWMGLNPDQSFALSALFSTVTVFLGFFILTRMISEFKEPS